MTYSDENWRGIIRKKESKAKSILPERLINIPSNTGEFNDLKKKETHAKHSTKIARCSLQIVIRGYMYVRVLAHTLSNVINIMQECQARIRLDDGGQSRLLFLSGTILSSYYA